MPNVCVYKNPKYLILIKLINSVLKIILLLLLFTPPLLLLKVGIWIQRLHILQYCIVTENILLLYKYKKCSDNPIRNHVLVLTSVCTMCGLCVRKCFTPWKMSTVPSAFTLSMAVLMAQKAPDRPTPALEVTGDQVNQGVEWDILYTHLQWTTTGWFPLCCCLFTTWSIRSTIPAPVEGEPCSGQPV